MQIDIQILNDIARRAGEKILKYYHSSITVDRKDDNSPLTQADMEAHREIVNGLKDSYPDIPIISEESEVPKYEIRKNWPRFFLWILWTERRSSSNGMVNLR